MTTVHPVPPWALLEIGNVSVSAGILESTVRNVVITQLGLTTPYADCATRELSFKQLIAIAKCFEAEKDQESDAYRELNGLLQRAQTAMDRRNSIIHSEWGLRADGALVRFKTTAKFGQGLRTAEVVETAQTLKQAAHEILTCDSALWVWGRTLFQRLHTC